MFSMHEHLTDGIVLDGRRDCPARGPGARTSGAALVGAADWRAPGRRCPCRVCGGMAGRRRRGGHDARGGRIHRVGARAGTGRRDRRRALRERFEGHQHRGGETGDRELRFRGRGDSRRPIQGRRLPRSGRPARIAAGDGDRDWRGAAGIAEALGARVPVHGAADMSSAVRTAFASASPGGTVVLAPACASFDMFRDYAQRGHAFKQEVRRLQEEWSVTREQ